MPQPTPPPDPDADLFEGEDEESIADIRRAAKARVLAGRMREREQEQRTAKCSRCGKLKNQGEHGESKCRKKGGFLG